MSTARIRRLPKDIVVRDIKRKHRDIRVKKILTDFALPFYKNNGLVKILHMKYSVPKGYIQRLINKKYKHV